jgi:hypothetical protein
MEWIDFDDFLRKYDSTVNPDNFAKRNLIWSLFQELEYMLYQNLVDRETVRARRIMQNAEFISIPGLNHSEAFFDSSAILPLIMRFLDTIQ